jgi:hypothetical protein
LVSASQEALPERSEKQPGQEVEEEGELPMNTAMPIKKVFLSSTAQDLGLYRDAVYKAIEGLDGYHCIRMEDFGARDTDPDSFCRVKVAECSMFVCIIGHEYGSCPPGSDVSYTEGEYDAAVKEGVKRLIFLLPDDFLVPAHPIGSADEGNRQWKFRERVKVDVMVDYFSSSEELAGQVRQAIHNCQEQIVKMNQYMPPPDKVHSSHRRTWLLYPFVTNKGGFDTGISVSNVSADPIGTEHQAGTTIAIFYGENAPTPIRSTSVPPGTVYDFLCSSVAPGFKGYLIVECNFNPARGFAILSDIGAQNLATGYLAETLRVEPTPRELTALDTSTGASSAG